MQQVYFGQYELVTDDKLGHSIVQPVLADGNDSTEQLLDYDSQTALNLPIAGNGAPLLALQNHQVCHDDIWPDAVVIGQLGIAQFANDGGTEAAQALPKYLRNQAWKTLKEQGKA
jgi:tRNA threonylcarbamoyladenosine biosynthesis protein TsaB